MSHKPFEISYRQHTPAEALRLYADWLLAQRTEEPFPFFACHEPNERTIS